MYFLDWLKEIITSSWSQDPKDRKTFDEISEILGRYYKKKKADITIYIYKKGEDQEDAEDCLLTNLSVNGLRQLLSDQYKEENIESIKLVKNDKREDIVDTLQIKLLEDDSLIEVELSERGKTPENKVPVVPVKEFKEGAEIELEGKKPLIKVSEKTKIDTKIVEQEDD